MCTVSSSSDLMWSLALMLLLPLFSHFCLSKVEDKGINLAGMYYASLTVMSGDRGCMYKSHFHQKKKRSNYAQAG